MACLVQAWTCFGIPCTAYVRPRNGSPRKTMAIPLLCSWGPLAVQVTRWAPISRAHASLLFSSQGRLQFFGHADAAAIRATTRSILARLHLDHVDAAALAHAPFKDERARGENDREGRADDG